MWIGHSAAFLMGICGGASCTTVLLFCNSCFISADALFSIMFNFGACPAFSNVSYNTSYERNMHVSIIVFMGYTLIVLLSYA